MKLGPRNLLLTHHQWGDAASPTRIPLGSCEPKPGGRPADLGDMKPRHRRMVWSSIGATGAGACYVVRVSGMARIWTRVPEAGDELVGRVIGKSRIAGIGDWLKLRVAGVEWWDYGGTLEILVQVVEHKAAEPQGRSRAGTLGTRTDQQATRKRVTAKRPLAARTPAALLPVLWLCGLVFNALGSSAMAENAGGGTYAELPLEQMNAWIRETAGRFGEEAVREDLPLAAEAVLSEAQVNSPRLTGFLSDSHTVMQDDSASGGGVVIGVNTIYALAVHETHPTKKRWFTSAIVANFPRVLQQLLVKRARERGAR